MRVLPELAAVAVAAVTLLWGSGLLVARPLLPRRYFPLLPLFAPCLGFALIAALGQLLGVAGVALRPARWIFIALAAAGWAALLFDRRLRRFPRSSAAAVVVCALAFLLAVVPLFALGYLTTVGASIDAISYATRSEYLQDAPLRAPEPEPGRPFLGWVGSQIDLLRVGDVYLLGLLGVVTGRRSYELLTVLSALFFALTAGAVFVWARSGLRLRPGGALLAAALAGLSNLLLWPVYDNFLSQTVALSLLPLLLCCGVEGEGRRAWRVALLFGVLLATLAASYPVYAVYGLAGVLAFWAAAPLLRRRARARPAPRPALRWWLVAGIAAAVWNAPALARAATELGFVARLLGPQGGRSVGAGNILVFPPLSEVIGLVAHAAAAYGEGWRRVPVPVLAALALAFAAVAVYGWWKLPARPRGAAAALLLASAALAAQQRWGVDPPHGYPYGWFKAISALTPQVLALVAAGIAALWRIRSRRWLAAGAACLLLAINAKHTLWSQRYVLQERVIVDRDLIAAARTARAVAPGAWTAIDLSPGLRQHWLGYLLRDRQIRYREPLWIWDVASPGAAGAFVQYAIVEKSLDEVRRKNLGEPWYDPATYRRLGGTARYELRARRDASLGEQRWASRWRDAGPLSIGVASGDRTFTVRLGAESHTAALGAGTPRTLQVRLLAVGPAARLAVAGLATPQPALADGAWLLDLDLGCLRRERMEIERLAGEVLLSEVRLLGIRTGDPRACLEAAPLASGGAYLEQEVLPEGRVRLLATVVRPAQAGERAYRLGFHVIDPGRQALFGVWSLDFPPGARVRRGALEIDLRDRSAHGKVDGRAAPVVSVRFDTAAGSFEGDAVWWQLDPIEQLGLEPTVWFERTAGGKVAVRHAAAGARLQVLPAP